MRSVAISPYVEIRRELAKPVEDMWSTAELRDFFVKLGGDHANFNVLKPGLNHPNLTAELLEELCQLWPYEEEYLKAFAIKNRIEFSDNLLNYITFSHSRNVWDLLMFKFVNEVFTFEQVDILWHNASTFFKKYMVELFVVNELNHKIRLPAVAWVQYYILHSESVIARINLDEALGGSEGLRTIFVEYLKDFNEDNLDLSNLPLEWLTELAEVHVNLDDYYDKLGNLNNE